MRAAILWIISIFIGILFGLWQGSIFAGFFMIAIIFLFLLRE